MRLTRPEIKRRAVWPATHVGAAPEPRAAAQVHDDGLGPGHVLAGWSGPAAAGGKAIRVDPPGKQSNGFLDQEFGAAARHEDPGIHGDPQPAELGPAEDLLERQTGHPALHHGVELIRGPCRGGEQPGLILGEDAAGHCEPGDNVGVRYGSTLSSLRRDLPELAHPAEQ